jgi:hypothetical protein
VQPGARGTPLLVHAPPLRPSRGRGSYRCVLRRPGHRRHTAPARQRVAACAGPLPRWPGCPHQRPQQPGRSPAIQTRRTRSRRETPKAYLLTLPMVQKGFFSMILSSTRNDRTTYAPATAAQDCEKHAVQITRARNGQEGPEIGEGVDWRERAMSRANSRQCHLRLGTTYGGAPVPP